MIDQAVKAKLDSLVEAEVIQGFRIVDVPHTVQRILDDARQINPDLPSFQKVRFTKLTPRTRALVSEAVLERYHQDLKKTDLILSKSRIRDLNIERGEWSVEKEKTIERLQRSTNRLMQELAVDGFDKESVWRMDISKYTAEYLDALDKSDKHADEKTFLKELFWRWLNYSKAARDEYTELYAKSQNREEYSPDVDLERLYNTSPTPEASTALANIDDNQYNLQRYVQLFNERQELAGLLQEQALMYAQSVESRRENTEELARLYYGCVAIGEDGTNQGSLTKTLDQFWDLPEEVVGWLIEEAYFFYNSVPKAIRAHMNDWGFTTAGRESGLLALSEESPAPQSSNTDTPQSEETPSDSSELELSKT